MYKLSVYNHYIRYNDRVLYFNSRTLSNFLLSVDEHRKMKDKLADPITFEFSFPTIFQQFRKWGFFVEEGIDEFGEIKYRNMSNMHDKSKAHILINLSDDELNTAEKRDISAISSRLKMHFKSRMSDPDLKEICLEWYATSDKYFKKLIYPITLFIKRECENRAINFSSQLDLKALKIENGNTYQFKEMSVNAISLNHFLLEKNSCQPEAGIKPRLLNRFLAMLGETVAINPMLHFNLNVYVKKNSKRKKIGAIAHSIQSCVSDNVSINLFSVFDDGRVRAEYPLMITKLDQKDQWRMMNESMMMNYSIDYNGSVYFGRYVTLDKCRCIGQICEDGEVEYDSVKWGYYYGIFWFENQQCAQCKFLPLLMDICSRKFSYFGNARHVVCPIKDNSLDTDNVIINIFESKQYL